MTRYSTGKYSQFQYGATDLEHPLYALEVDWDGNGLFEGFNDARDRITDMSIERGRQYTISASGDTFEEEETGKFSATLLDDDRRYDVYNEDSPLFGLLTGGKLFRMRMRTLLGGIKHLMAGKLEEPVSFKERGMNMVRLDGHDGWSMLRDQSNEVTIPLQENIYVDEAIALILEQAGWPRAWGYDLEPGVDLRPYYWVESRSPAAAIHELAFNELGNVAIGADGALRYRSRLSLESEVLTLTDDDVLHVRRMTPSEVIRNVLKVRSAPRSELSVAEVWRMGGELDIDPGEVIDDLWAEFTYGSVTVPVKNPITPAPTTDYTAFSASGGGGSNLTGNIGVSMTPFSTRAKLRLQNTGGTKAYINLMKMRGNPLVASNTSTFESQDAASIRQFGRKPFTLTVDQNVNIARQYREILAAYLTNSRNYLVVDLVPNPEVQFSADLGEIISGQFSHWRISDSFRVIKILHTFLDPSGIVVNTRFWLEPFVRLFTGVQLPVQLPFQLGTV